jgi:hypothetical protein
MKRIFLVVIFVLNTLCPPMGYTQVSFLPAAGQMVPLTSPYSPVAIRGMQLHPDNPFKFDFIVDTGDSKLGQDELKAEGQKLIGYFLASLTTPEKDMWVNLSPYEKDRIIPETFGHTEMGKDLLAQDYLLKQIMATALYPERTLGKAFWQRVYSEAQAKFGTTNVPVNTFNKVWILPDEAVVYENGKTNAVFVVKSSLKVMLEQDYLAAKKNLTPVSDLGSQIIREIVIPALTKEVNEGRNFAPLRQVYQSLILAAWYKKNLHANALAQAYVDHNKIKGVDVADKGIAQKIYGQYLQAYRKGVYNFIKEEADPITKTTVPRKYFSGGFSAAMLHFQETADGAMAAREIENEHLVDMSMEAEPVASPEEPSILDAILEAREAVHAAQRHHEGIIEAQKTLATNRTLWRQNIKLFEKEQAALGLWIRKTREYETLIANMQFPTLTPRSEVEAFFKNLSNEIKETQRLIEEISGDTDAFAGYNAAKAEAMNHEEWPLFNEYLERILSSLADKERQIDDVVGQLIKAREAEPGSFGIEFLAAHQEVIYAQAAFDELSSWSEALRENRTFLRSLVPPIPDVLKRQSARLALKTPAGLGGAIDQVTKNLAYLSPVLNRIEALDDKIRRISRSDYYSYANSQRIGRSFEEYIEDVDGTLKEAKALIQDWEIIFLNLKSELNTLGENDRQHQEISQELAATQMEFEEFKRWIEETFPFAYTSLTEMGPHSQSGDEVFGMMALLTQKDQRALRPMTVSPFEMPGEPVRWARARRIIIKEHMKRARVAAQVAGATLLLSAIGLVATTTPAVGKDVKPAIVYDKGKRDAAMNGGIDVTQVNVMTQGGEVRTAFSDPAQVQILLHAQGLVPVIFKIQLLSTPMVDALLGR